MACMDYLLFVFTIVTSGVTYIVLSCLVRYVLVLVALHEYDSRGGYAHALASQPS